MTREKELEMDYQTLWPFLQKALKKALRDGVEKYPISTWPAVSVEKHCSHLFDHTTRLTDILLIGASEDEEDHLSHIICRAAMIAAKKELK